MTGLMLSIIIYCMLLALRERARGNHDATTRYLAALIVWPLMVSVWAYPQDYPLAVLYAIAGGCHIGALWAHLRPVRA